MSIHNICFHGEIRKIPILFALKKSLSGAVFCKQTVSL